jgi:hypothetical protein
MVPAAELWLGYECETLARGGGQVHHRFDSNTGVELEPVSAG